MVSTLISREDARRLAKSRPVVEADFAFYMKKLEHDIEFEAKHGHRNCTFTLPANQKLESRIMEEVLEAGYEFSLSADCRRILLEW